MVQRHTWLFSRISKGPVPYKILLAVILVALLPALAVDGAESEVSGKVLIAAANCFNPNHEGHDLDYYLEDKTSGQRTKLFGSDEVLKKLRPGHTVRIKGGWRDGTLPRAEFSGAPARSTDVGANFTGGGSEFEVATVELLDSPVEEPLVAAPTGGSRAEGAVTAQMLSCLLVFASSLDNACAVDVTNATNLLWNNTVNSNESMQVITKGQYGLQLGNGSAESPIVEMQLNMNSAGTTRYQMESAMMSALGALGYNRYDYDRVLLFPPEGTETFTAYAYFPSSLTSTEKGRISVYGKNYGNLYMSGYLHELGHSFGMHHSSVGGSEYGDQTCVMGVSNGRGDTEGYNNAKLLRKGLLDAFPGAAVTVNSDTVLNLYPLHDDSTQTTGAQSIEIGGTSYVLGYRQNAGPYYSLRNQLDHDRLHVYSITNELRVKTDRQARLLPGEHFQGTAVRIIANNYGPDKSYVSVTIDFPDDNAVPLAEGQAHELLENSSKSVTLSATDDDGDDLTYTIVDAPQRGTLTGIAPNFTYVPNPGYYGYDSFSFTANDGAFDSNHGTVSFTVNPLRTPVDGVISFEDWEGTSGGDDWISTEYAPKDVAFAELVNVPASASPGPASGVDPTGKCAELTAGVSKSALTLRYPLQLVRGGHSAFTVSYAIRYDRATNVPALEYSANGSFNDAEVVQSHAGYLTKRWYGDESVTLVDGVDGIVFTDSAKVRWVNGNHNKDVIWLDDVEIRVGEAPNSAPVAQGDSVVTDEDVAVAITLNASDADGDSLTYTYSQAANGTLSGIAPDLTYTPNPGFIGVDGFTFTADDGTDVSNLASISITVGEFIPNTPPVVDAGVDQTVILSGESATGSEVELVHETFAGSDAVALAGTSTETYDAALVDSGGAGTWAGNTNMKANGYTRGNNAKVVSLPLGSYFNGAKGSSDAVFELAATLSQPTEGGGYNFLSFSSETAPGSATNSSLVASIGYARDGAVVLSQGPGFGSLVESATLSGDRSFIITLDFTPTHYDGVASFGRITWADSVSGVLGETDLANELELSSIALVTDGTLSGSRTANTFSALSLTKVAGTGSVAVASLSGSVSDPDVDPVTTSWNLESGPVGATVVFDDSSSVNATATFTQLGTYTLRLTADDGAESAFDDVIITVTDGTVVNNAPVASDDSMVTDEDLPVAVTLVGNDADGDALTYSYAAPANGSLSGTAPDLTYTPNLGFFGSDAFTFTTNDGTDDSNIATVTITVNEVIPPNTAPTVDAGADQTLVLAAAGAGGEVELVSETFGGSSSVSLAGTSTEVFDATLSSAGGSGTWGGSTNLKADGYTRGNNAKVTYLSLGSYLNDAKGSSDARFELTATLTQPNEGSGYNFISFSSKTAPASATNASMLGGIGYARNGHVVLATGPGFGSRTSAATLSGNRTLTITLDFTPAYYDGLSSFGRIVWSDSVVGVLGTSDLTSDLGVGSIAIVTDGTLSGSRTANVFSALSLSQSAGGFASVSTTLAGTATDADGDTLTTVWTEVAGPAAVELADAAATETTATFTALGVYTLRLTAADGTEQTSDEVVITVTDGSANTAPVASDGGAVTDEDVAVAVILSASDADGNALTYSYSAPASGTLSGTAPNLTYTPNLGFFGIDSFTFTANDGTDESNVATVSITVNEVVPPNNAPVAQNGTVVTDEDTAVAVNLSASDADGDALNYSYSTPANGTLSGTAPNLTYTPNLGFFGSDSFTFTANDGTGDSNVATVSITVNEVTPPPTTGVSTESQIVHFAFDEVSGTTAIDGITEDGESNDGSLVGSPAWRPDLGVSGGALNFDGIDDAVRLTDSNSINLVGGFSHRTIALHFAADDVSDAGAQILYEEGGGTRGFNLYLRAGMLFVGAWGNGEGFLSAPAPTDGGWHHVALVLNGPNLTGYLDGVAFASQSGMSAFKKHGDDIGIGSVNGKTKIDSGSVTKFAGMIDEFVLYNRALMASEVGNLAGIPAAGSAGGAEVAASGAEAASDFDGELYELAVTGAAQASLTFGVALEAAATNSNAVAESAAYFVDEAGNATGYDIRSLAACVRWRVVVDATAGPAELSWPALEAPEGMVIYLQQQSTGKATGLAIDMAAAGFVTCLGTTEFEIILGIPETATIELARGWNLVSPPLVSTAIDVDVTKIHVRNGRRWRSLTDGEALLPQSVYFVYSDGPGELIVTGLPAATTWDLQAGRNLVATSTHCRFPATATPLPAYRWDTVRQRYLAVVPGDVLEAGTGLWISSPVPVSFELDAE